MVPVLFSKTRNLKKLLSNEFQCWFFGVYFSFSPRHRPDVMHSPFFGVNHFNTCQWFFKENIENVENFNPSKMIIRKDGSVEKKKKKVGVKVYLLNDKGISSSMMLQDAEKLAQRQKLELKKVDVINGTDAYKLVPLSEVLEGAVKNTKTNEKVKKIIISADINPNDLQIKINQINKFLDKGLKVFVKLGERNDEPNKLSAIYDKLEKSLASHSIHKVGSKSGLLINITPKQKDSGEDKEKQ